jgi:predicted transcriptional regulator
MKTVILEVRNPENGMSDFVETWKSGKANRNARISFAAPELLWKVLTAKRWEVLKALCGAGPVSIREAARRVNRDVKAVHGDITALLAAGLLNRAPGGRVEFPYEAVKVEFLLQAA